MTTFFKNIYNPSTNDIQRVFPEYSPMTREQLLILYNTERAESGISCQQDAVFALNKLDKVTTRYKLTPDQRIRLGELAVKTDSVDWTEFCTVLDPVQIEYVGW